MSEAGNQGDKDDKGGKDAKVDPAALLTGVLAVGVGPLLDEGEWTALNTAIAFIVAFVLLAFYIKSDRWERLGPLEQSAVVAVMWGMLVIALAWPMQQRFTKDCPESTDEQEEACENDRANKGTGLATIPAALVVLAYWWLGTPGPSARPRVEHEQ